MAFVVCVRYYESWHGSEPRAEMLLRVDQIATMPNYRPASEVPDPHGRTRWTGDIVLNNGHKIVLCADLEQWNLIASAMAES